MYVSKQIHTCPNTHLLELLLDEFLLVGALQLLAQPIHQRHDLVRGVVVPATEISMRKNEKRKKIVRMMNVKDTPVYDAVV